MTLRFIEFKTNELQNSEPQPATSPSVASSELKDSGSNDSAESNFEELNCFTQSFFELIEFIIRCWTFISFFSDQTGRSRPEAALI